MRLISYATSSFIRHALTTRAQSIAATVTYGAISAHAAILTALLSLRQAKAAGRTGWPTYERSSALKHEMATRRTFTHYRRLADYDDESLALALDTREAYILVP